MRLLNHILLWLSLAAPGLATARSLPEFMIFTYGVELTEKNLEALARMGFNTVYGPAEKRLLCRKHGLKLMIPNPGPAVAANLRGDPDVWGYDLMDEPISLAQLHEAAQLVRVYRQADPTHPTFVNLNQKAGRWIDLFLETVQPDFLSYDEYPWWYGGIYEWFTGQQPLFVKLEQHRDAALAAGLPLTVWREVNTQRNIPGSPERNWVTPPGNAPKIRQNVYASLAYGAKGILWFTGQLLLDRQTGEINETGRQVAEINRELRLLGPVLFPLRSTGVFHTDPVPDGSRRVSPDHWVQPVGEGLVIGTFRDARARNYVMVVNKSWQSVRKARLQFRLFLEEIRALELFDKRNGRWTPLALRPVPDTRDPAYIYSLDNIPERMKKYITYNQSALSPKELAFFERYHTYPPPYEEVSVDLAPGDGELLQVTLKAGQDIPDPRK
jgi:hypothetical protein